jgi:hypothetical protein
MHLRREGIASSMRSVECYCLVDPKLVHLVAFLLLGGSVEWKLALRILGKDMNALRMLQYQLGLTSRQVMHGLCFYIARESNVI